MSGYLAGCFMELLLAQVKLCPAYYAEDAEYEKLYNILGDDSL